MIGLRRLAALTASKHPDPGISLRARLSEVQPTFASDLSKSGMWGFGEHILDKTFFTTRKGDIDTCLPILIDAFNQDRIGLSICLPLCFFEPIIPTNASKEMKKKLKKESFKNQTRILGNIYDSGVLPDTFWQSEWLIIVPDRHEDELKNIGTILRTYSNQKWTTQISFLYDDDDLIEKLKALVSVLEFRFEPTDEPPNDPLIVPMSKNADDIPIQERFLSLLVGIYDGEIDIHNKDDLPGNYSLRDHVSAWFSCAVYDFDPRAMKWIYCSTDSCINNWWMIPRGANFDSAPKIFTCASMGFICQCQPDRNVRRKLQHQTQNQIEELKQELAKKNGEIEKLKRHDEAMNNAVLELERELDHAKAAHDQSHKAIVTSRAAQEALVKGQIDKLNQELAKKQDEFEKLNRQYNDLKEELALKVHLLEVADRQNHDLSQSIDDERVGFQNLSNRVLELENAVLQITKERDNAMADLLRSRREASEVLISPAAAVLEASMVPGGISVTFKEGGIADHKETTQCPVCGEPWVTGCDGVLLNGFTGSPRRISETVIKAGQHYACRHWWLRREEGPQYKQTLFEGEGGDDGPVRVYDRSISIPTFITRKIRWAVTYAKAWDVKQIKYQKSNKTLLENWAASEKIFLFLHDKKLVREWILKLFKYADKSKFITVIHLGTGKCC